MPAKKIFTALAMIVTMTAALLSPSASSAADGGGNIFSDGKAEDLLGIRYSARTNETSADAKPSDPAGAEETAETAPDREGGDILSNYAVLLPAGAGGRSGSIFAEGDAERIIGIRPRASDVQQQPETAPSPTQAPAVTPASQTEPQQRAESGGGGDILSDYGTLLRGRTPGTSDGSIFAEGQAERIIGVRPRPQVTPGDVQPSPVPQETARPASPEIPAEMPHDEPSTAPTLPSELVIPQATQEPAQTPPSTDGDIFRNYGTLLPRSGVRRPDGSIMDEEAASRMVNVPPLARQQGQQTQSGGQQAAVPAQSPVQTPAQPVPPVQSIEQPDAEQTPMITQRVVRPSPDWSNVAEGSVVTFGVYEQNNSPDDGPEPLEWLVLARERDGVGYRLLMLSRYCIDVMSYDSTFGEITWEDSSIRRWLNDEFYSAAFSDDERRSIASVTLTNANNAAFGTRGGSPTDDRVFLLSINEMQRHMGSGKPRKATITPYAAERGAWVNGFNGGSWWWLRSPGLYQTMAAYVSDDGRVDTTGEFVVNTYTTIRPALWVRTNP